MNLLRLLRGKRIIVTVGAGGVGKTTLAAAIGLSLSMMRNKVMVITIDPAKRLASALGLHTIGDTPHEVDLHALSLPAQGSLHVMMLDTSEVFKSLVKRHIRDEQQQQRILNNSFFQRFTEAMSGTQEHAAIEKLYELHSLSAYDVIVLDTPPSRHALEFLTAPERLINVLDDTVLRWLVMPAKGSLSMISFGSRYITKVLSLFTGTAMLRDLTEFVTLFSGQLAGFRDRAAAVQRLLKAPSTAFLAVAGPERHALEGALMFHRALVKQHYNLEAFIVNRLSMVSEQPLTRDLFERTLKRQYSSFDLPEGFTRRAYDSYIHQLNVSRIHMLKSEQLIAMTNLNYPVYYLPAIEEEIVNLSGVCKLGKLLVKAKDQRNRFKDRK